jgi:hypothetical protein
MTATDFDEIKRVALKESRSLLAKWLPGGEFTPS